MNILSTKNLTLGYNGHSVVKDLDIEIAQGAVVGIIGPNGSGKSTLLRALAGLLKPFNGNSYLNNKEIQTISPQERARCIGWVPQRQNYVWPLTVEDTVTLGRAPHRGWFLPYTATDQAVVERTLKMTELTALRHRRIDKLSGGEFQRAIIARALVQEPEILLLDEPTANLDIHHQIQVFDMLLDLVKNEKLTAVIAIHDLSLAARFCDQLILLNQGQCYGKGNPVDVLSPQNIKSVFGIEAQLYQDPWGYWALSITMEYTIMTEQNSIDRSAYRKKKGLVMVYTGNGKGKTTAALGMLMRAWGRDLKVAMVQFIKHEKSRYGEIRAAEKMGIEWHVMGDGWTWTSKDMDQTIQRGVEGWEKAKGMILSNKYDIIVLDEFTYPLYFGWLDANDVVDWLIKNKPEMLHLVITGRDAPSELIEYADLVTEMREIKHPFNEQKILAQPGVDY